MKLRVKVAVVLNARESAAIARICRRHHGGGAPVKSSPQEIEEENRVSREFIEKSIAALGVASTDERDG